MNTPRTKPTFGQRVSLLIHRAAWACGYYGAAFRHGFRKERERLKREQLINR